MTDQEPDQTARADAEYVARQRDGAMPAAVVLGIGTISCLCGGAGLFNETSGGAEGTGGPVVLPLAAGTVLVLAGFAWLRFRFRRTAYRLTHAFSPGLALIMLILFGLAAALPFGLAALLDKAGVRITAGPLLLVLLPMVVGIYTRMRSALVMNPVGLAMVGSGQVPWSSVAQIVVTPLDNGREVEISVRLRSGAPLPEGPMPPGTAAADPAARQVRVAVPRRKLKLPRLVAAIARFGPPGITVIERTAAGERVVSA